jgi:hypothetical protein
MNIPLASFLSAVAGPIAKRVLISLGFGILSFTGISSALNSLIATAQSDYSTAGAYASAVMGLCGLGMALGMISAALVFRVTFDNLPRIALLSK